MHIVTMPQAGNTMEEGTVIEWRKAEGDSVKAGEVLLEVETDKSTIEVEASEAGILRKILCPEGSTVPVRTPIAVLAAKDEDISKALEEAEAQVQQADGDSTKGGAPGAAESSNNKNESKDSKPSELTGKGDSKSVTPILMPSPGQSVEEATLLAWKVKPGDQIKTGQIIFEIETDKSNVEIEAADSGRLARIVVQEGEMVPVQTPLAYLADNDADVDAYLADATPSQPKADEGPSPDPSSAPSAPKAPATSKPAGPTPTTDSGRVKASPAARRLAAQKGLDLSQAGGGSGPRGRILSTDVAAAASRQPAAAPRPVASTEVTRRKMSGMRRAIARNLTQSKGPIPHFYMQLTIDAGPLMAFYRGEKAKYPCSLNDLVTLACSRAIMEFPAFRSQIDGEEIVEFPTANIGIAVGMDDGLVVPVLVGADGMSLKGIAQETKRLVTTAQGGKPENMGRGVFTISNLGMFGIESFSAIINPPEAAILAVGAAREEVIVENGAMRPGRRMTMTLSCDHRLIDGLMAAKFLGRLKEFLEIKTPLA